MSSGEIVKNEQVNPLVVAQSQAHAVQLASAVLDKQVMTARQFPRSVAKFKSEAESLLSLDIETARSAEYKKPVGGGFVNGPSARLTEIASMCWTNLQVKLDDPVISETSVTVCATAWDLEKNVIQPGIATASIVNKQGIRYQQHMIETTIAATASKARRNAILAVIPRAYINDLMHTARKIANENEEPLETVRKKMLEFFARSHRVTSDQVCDFLGIKGVDDITQDHIAELRTVVTAIQEGEPVEEFFGKTQSKTDIAKQKLAERRAKDESKVEA